MPNLINDEIFICLDCYMDHHEGRAMKDNSVSWTDNNSEPDGEETRTIDFSARPCGCCGTTLAGERYQMAIWEL